MLNKVPVLGRVRKCIELAKAQNIKNKVVIDVGCSNGLLAYHLLSQKPKKYLGVDPSEEAIMQARKNIKKAEFYQAEAGKLPFKSKMADVVLMFDVIEHTLRGSEVKALKESFRVLNKRGVLLLSTPNSHPVTNFLDPAWFLGHRHYQVKNLNKLIKRAGFKVESSQITGGLWFSIYLLWIYISKWIFGIKLPRNKFLEIMDDKQFDKNGIHTIFVKAIK